MELREYFGRSGRIYIVHYSPETYWNVWTKGPNGFMKMEAKTAANDCGADQHGTTHDRWKQLWFSYKVKA